MVLNKELNIEIEHNNRSAVYYDTNNNDYATQSNLLPINCLDERLDAATIVTHLLNLNSNESLIYKIVVKHPNISLTELINKYVKTDPCSDRTIIRHLNTLLDKKVIISSNNRLTVSDRYNIKNNEIKFIVIKL